MRLKILTSIFLGLLFWQDFISKAAAFEKWSEREVVGNDICLKAFSDGKILREGSDGADDYFSALLFLDKHFYMFQWSEVGGECARIEP